MKFFLRHDDDWAMLLINGLSLALMKKGTHPDHIAFVVDRVEDIPCSSGDLKTHRDKSIYYYQEASDGSVIEWLCWPENN